MSAGLTAILKIFFSYRWRVVLGVACLLLVDAGQLAVPLVVREVIDRVAAQRATGQFLLAMAGVLAGLALGIAGFRFAWRHLFFVAARMAELDLRTRIYQHALALTSRQAQATATGEVMALAINDVESVRRALAMGFVAGFDAFIFSVFAVTTMFWLAPGVTLWAVLPLPLLALLMRASLKAVYERWDAVQESFATMTERARESISGIRVLKAFARLPDDEQRFAAASREYFDRYLHYTRVDALFRPAILLLTGVCMAILLAVGGLRAIDDQLSLGTFVALTTYLGMLTWPMIAAGWMAALLQRSIASMDRIQAFLAREREPAPQTSADSPVTRGEIELRDLSFSYPGADRPALRGLSLRVPAGTSLGVVGEIGSGKSTLAQLLARIHDPPPGGLFIDGLDVSNIDRAQLRQAISMVPQEAFLFSDTIEANLLVGDPTADAARLEQACRSAAVAEEIAGFERGYQTLLGERGLTLSGGQKQRVCLARALLKQAPILVLDDTLSAVDADTEGQIIASLQGALTGRTAVIISHRTSAVRALDQIVVLGQGRIIQRGTHAELIAQPGYYRQMAELQELECCE
jgi:ATP-binding cassette subfamily B protein